MRTIVDLPDELFRQAKARAALEGQSLEDLVAQGLKLILESPRRFAGSTSLPKALPRKHGSAGAWARRFAGVAQPAPGELLDNARMDHYRNKFGVK